MKKVILIIFSMCLLFSETGINAAERSSVYTLSGNCVYDVPLYTAAKDFMQNIESDEEVSVVVKSVSNDSYSNIGKNSFVTQQCLLKCGERLYSIDTIDPIERETLKNGESFVISRAFNWNSPFIMLSFSMSGRNDFSKCGITLNNGENALFSFEKGADGFSSIVSGDQKVHLLRYNGSESLFAEIFIISTGEKIVIEKLFINGEECDVDLSFDKEGTDYSLAFDGAEGTIDNLCVSSAGSITSLYKGNYLITSGEDVKVFENYGKDNTDSVFLATGTAENADTPFGTEIVQGKDSLLVKDLFSQTNEKKYKILFQMPTLGKVQLFKGTDELFALTDGAISVKRTVSDDYVTIMALYSQEGKIKNVSFEKTTVFECEKSDSIKVFILFSKESIIPITVAAHITKDGIFHNDGFVVKGE